MYRLIATGAAAIALAATPAMAQNANASATPHAATTAAHTSDRAPRFVAREVAQTTPAGYKAASGDNLPVCSPKQQDGCINSWEKNRTGNRPLEYWPGKPASEIPGKVPAKKPGK